MFYPLCEYPSTFAEKHLPIFRVHSGRVTCVFFIGTGTMADHGELRDLALIQMFTMIDKYSHEM
jgi:hypothetical protein